MGEGHETNLERVGQFVREKLVSDPDLAKDLHDGGAIFAMNNIQRNPYVAGRHVQGLSDEVFDGTSALGEQKGRLDRLKEERNGRLIQRKAGKR
jgi:hypothetical protein